MPAIDEDDKPKKKIAHEIGQDLSLLSVEELGRARALLMHDEIARLEADMEQNARLAQRPPINFSSGDHAGDCAGAQKSGIGGNSVTCR